MTTTTTTAPAPAPAKLSRDEVTKARKELHRAIVADDADDTALLEYLERFASIATNARKTHGMFKRWSASNIQFLEAQRRIMHEHHIGLYAGRSQWEQLDRSIREDATPKMLWAPSVRREEDEDDGDTQRHGRRSVRFIAVPVFDWSDTISNDPNFVEPSWKTPLAAGDQDTLERLAATTSLDVRFENWGSRPVKGVCAKRADGSGYIVVDSSQPIGNQIGTLGHELAHDLLDHAAKRAAAPSEQQTQLREQGEQEAELTSWLVMKMLGLDAQVGEEMTRNSMSYLRSWSADGETVAGHKKRMKLLDKRLNVALEAAETILDRFVAQADSPSEEAAAA